MWCQKWVPSFVVEARKTEKVIRKLRKKSARFTELVDQFEVTHASLFDSHELQMTIS